MVTWTLPLPDFLYQPDPGEIRVTGTRIGLFHVVREFQNGATAEMIAAEFDLQPLSLAYKLIVYYLENKAVVDEYVRAYQAVLDHQYATGRKLDVAKLQARMEEILQTQQRAGA